MSFITYAQNFEDLMLYRALRNVDKGFYIDLGAADPDSHSVTRAFYERGWRGINVEPHPWFYRRLTERRTEDVNINAAVSDKTGEAQFFFVDENAGLSTLDGDMAQWHQDHGLPVRAEKVHLTTLRDICTEHVGDSTIHFLKIDVEGHELAALRGNDFGRWRPWVVLGEAHDEHGTWEAWKLWQELLEQNGYRFVYQDGLNRYFVAAERYDDLAKAFRAPPNVYDNWKHAETAYFEQRANAAEAMAANLQQQIASHSARANEQQALLDELCALRMLPAQLATTQAAVTAARAEVEAAKAEVAALRGSISWRITTPLRRITSLFKGWTRGNIRAVSRLG